MTFEDYKRETLENAINAAAEWAEWACEYPDEDEFESMFYDLECNDSVTGNGSGSFTFSTFQAQENIKDVLFDSEFLEYVEDMGLDICDLLKQGAEAVDVVARCAALEAVRDDLEEAWNDAADETRAEFHTRFSEILASKA